MLYIGGHQKNAATGTITVAVRAESEEYRKENAMTNQTNNPNKATGQHVININPNDDATPLPPLNFSQIGKLCPIIPQVPAISEAIILRGVLMPRKDTIGSLGKTCKAINAANPALKASRMIVRSANHLFPVRNTLVPPILPEPIFLISPYPAKKHNTKPKGIEPRK